MMILPNSMLCGDVKVIDYSNYREDICLTRRGKTVHFTRPFDARLSPFDISGASDKKSY